MEIQEASNKVILEQSRQDWRVEIKLFNVVQLTSNSVSINCNKIGGIFEVKFICQLDSGDSGKTWDSYNDPKSVVMNISYKGVPVYNISEQNVNISQSQSSKEFIVVSTKRLNSLAEIGKIQHENDTFYYVIYKSNYSEQKIVCEKALVIQKML